MDLTERLTNLPGWNRVRFTLSTHSAGKLTELDLDVADRIERAFGGTHGPTDQS